MKKQNNLSRAKNVLFFVRFIHTRKIETLSFRENLHKRLFSAFSCCDSSI